MSYVLLLIAHTLCRMYPPFLQQQGGHRRPFPFDSVCVCVFIACEDGKERKRNEGRVLVEKKIKNKKGGDGGKRKNKKSRKRRENLHFPISAYLTSFHHFPQH